MDNSDLGYIRLFRNIFIVHNPEIFEIVNRMLSLLELVIKCAERASNIDHSINNQWLLFDTYTWSF